MPPDDNSQLRALLKRASGSSDSPDVQKALLDLLSKIDGEATPGELVDEVNVPPLVLHRRDTIPRCLQTGRSHPSTENEMDSSPPPNPAKHSLAGTKRTRSVTIQLPASAVRQLARIGTQHCLNLALPIANTNSAPEPTDECENNSQSSQLEILQPRPTAKVSMQNKAAPAGETRIPTIRVGTGTTAPATTIAYTHDIFLELMAPNWQNTIWKAERPVKNDWFNGRNPNALKISGEIAHHIEGEQIVKNNRTIGGHIKTAENLIKRDWERPKEYSRKQTTMIYRTIYGYSQAVISAWELRTGDTISCGISNPGLTAAKLFQRIAPLPPGLTEEQLAECLDKCWGLYSLKYSGNWTL